MKLMAMVFAALLVGCGSPPELMMDTSVEVADGGQEEDSSVILDDGSIEDAGARDAEASTSLPRDSGTDGGDGGTGAGEDAAVPDGGGLPDSGVADSGVVDAGPPTRLDPVEITAYGQIFCARDTGNSVWCWGPGFVGIQYVGSFTSIEGLCGIRADGAVACFSSGSVTPINTAAGPLLASELGEGSGPPRGCAISGGEVWCWESGSAVRLPTIVGAVAVHVDGGCASSPSSTWCWDWPLSTATPVFRHTGGVYVKRGASFGTGLCIDDAGMYCDGGNRDCAFWRGSERAPGTFWPSGLVPGDIYAVGSGICYARGSTGVSIYCHGPGPQFGDSAPCDLRSVYAGVPLTEVTQMAAGSREVCALVRVVPGPRTIECWGSGSPSPVVW